MSAERDVNRIVRSWLGEDEHESADAILGIVLSRLDTTPQRRSWRPARRFAQMNRLTQVAIGAAAVLVVAIVGYRLIPATSVGPGATAHPTAAGPSPTTATSASRAPSGPYPLTLSVLAPGRYFLHPFDDAFQVSLTVPEGWEGAPPNAVTSTAGTSGPDGAAVAFLRPTQIFVDPCEGSTAGDPTISAGETADDLIAALGQVSSYELTAPTTVIVSGNPGKKFDLLLPPELDLSTCDGGQYWVWEAGPYAQGQGNRWHIWAIDLDGSRLVILGEDFATTPATVQTELQNIMASIKIDP